MQWSTRLGNTTRDYWYRSYAIDTDTTIKPLQPFIGINYLLISIYTLYNPTTYHYSLLYSLLLLNPTTKQNLYSLLL